MAVAVFGEALIDFIAGEDGAYRPHLGGSSYNVAIGLARQGIEISYTKMTAVDVAGGPIKTAISREDQSCI